MSTEDVLSQNLCLHRHHCKTGVSLRGLALERNAASARDLLAAIAAPWLRSASLCPAVAPLHMHTSVLSCSAALAASGNLLFGDHVAAWHVQMFKWAILLLSFLAFRLRALICLLKREEVLQVTEFVHKFLAGVSHLVFVLSYAGLDS